MAKGYQFHTYDRSYWDNFGDFLANFTSAFYAAEERRRTRKQEDLDRKLRFQSQDPELQESLRKTMSHEERVAMGLETKHKDAVQIGPDGKQKKGTTYMPVDTRPRTTAEAQQATMGSLQIQGAQQGLEQGALSMAGQRTQNALNELMLQLQTEKNPEEIVRIRQRVQALQSPDPMQRYVVGMGMAPDAAEQLYMSEEYPDLWKSGVMYKHDPNNPQKISERRNQYLAQFMDKFPNPATGLALADALANNDPAKLAQTLKPGTQTWAMLQYQQEKQRLAMSQRQLDQSMSIANANAAMSIMNQNPTLTLDAAKAIASNLTSGKALDPEFAAQYNEAAKIAFDTLKAEGQKNQAIVESKAYEDLRQTVTSLGALAKQGNLTDEQQGQMEAATSKLLEMTAQAYGIEMPEEGSGAWQYLTAAVGAATGLTNVAEQAFSTHTPETKAMLTMWNDIRQAVPGLGAFMPVGQDVVNKAAYDYKSMKELNNQLFRGMATIAKDYPVVGTGVKVFIEESAKQRMAEYSAATDPATRKQLEVQLKEYAKLLDLWEKK